jgi:hypothetical protein
MLLRILKALRGGPRKGFRYLPAAPELPGLWRETGGARREADLSAPTHVLTQLCDDYWHWDSYLPEDKFDQPVIRDARIDPTRDAAQGRARFLRIVLCTSLLLLGCSDTALDRAGLRAHGTAGAAGMRIKNIGQAEADDPGRPLVSTLFTISFRSDALNPQFVIRVYLVSNKGPQILHSVEFPQTETPVNRMPGEKGPLQVRPFRPWTASEPLFFSINAVGTNAKVTRAAEIASVVVFSFASFDSVSPVGDRPAGKQIGARLLVAAASEISNDAKHDLEVPFYQSIYRSGSVHDGERIPDRAASAVEQRLRRDLTWELDKLLDPRDLGENYLRVVCTAQQR